MDNEQCSSLKKKIVMPTNVGIHSWEIGKTWIPAFAGMTNCNNTRLLPSLIYDIKFSNF
jgi:hypothetical protein